MECALGWPEGVQLSARAGYSTAEALQLAIFRQDVDSVAQILAEGCPMFLDHRGPVWCKTSVLNACLCLEANWPPYTCRCPQPLDSETTERRQIRDLLVVAVRDRRDALTALAHQRLPSHKLRELGISTGRPLDTNAYATYETLLEAGISVDESLYPNKKPLLLSLRLMCPLAGLSIAKALVDSGVCELDPCVDGTITPLVSLFREPVANGRKEAVIRWFLEAGASATFPSASMLPNLLFYLASIYDPPGVCKREDSFFFQHLLFSEAASATNRTR